MARALRIYRNPAVISRKTSGMTLIEIIIVMSIIALLAAIAIPSYLRSRKRAQAMEVLQELRLLDTALEQYTQEHNLPGGTEVPFARLRPYLNQGTALYDTGNDLMGNPYGPFIIDTVPVVNQRTYEEFEMVADASFWSPYFREQMP